MSASWCALLPAPPVLAVCRWLELGGRHLHSHARPKQGFGQRRRGHRLARVSKSQAFLLLKLSEAVQLTFSQRTTRPGTEVVQRAPGVGPLPSRGAFLPAAGVFLRSGERKALLPASEWGFCVTQQDLPSNRPFLFKSTVSHTEDRWQFVFAAATRISLGIVVWD